MTHVLRMSSGSVLPFDKPAQVSIGAQIKSIEAWAELTSFLQPVGELKNILSNHNLLQHCFSNLTPLHVKQLMPWYLEQCENVFNTWLVPLIEKMLSGLSDTPGIELINGVHNFIQTVGERLAIVNSTLVQLSSILDLYAGEKVHTSEPHNMRIPQLQSKLVEIMNTNVFLNGFEATDRVFFRYYDALFALVLKVKFPEEDDMEIEADLETINKLLEQAAKQNQTIKDLNWIDSLEHAFSEVAFSRIESEMTLGYQALVNDKLEHLDRLQIRSLEHFKNLVEISIPAWLKIILPKSPNLMNDWNQRIDFFMYERFGKMRAAEIFDIVVDFPDSVPALQDLKECLDKTDLNFVEGMVTRFSSRLLHPGARTSDIIESYINTIKSLRILDPTGVALQKIGGIIRRYLRHRNDTVRAIVTHMLDEDNMNMDMTEDYQENHTPDIDNGRNWSPAAVHFDPNKIGMMKTSKDIVSYLVNVFGSSDSFVNEYRQLLANRLLTRTKDFFNIDIETRNLELLKLRFGQHSLRNCEVMIKDLSNAKRFNNGVFHDFKELRETTVTIISKHYWPSTNTDQITWPTSIQERFKHFHEVYETRRKPRKLKFYPQLGSVELEIILNKNKITIDCSPFCASAMLHLVESHAGLEPLPLSQLSDKLGAKPALVTAKMLFWIKRGLVSEVHQFKEVAYSLPRNAAQEEEAYRRFMSMEFLEEDEKNTALESGVQNDIDTQSFEDHILGLLNNRASTFPGLYNTLKMWLQFGTSLSEDRLQSSLDKLVEEGKLDCVNGMYGKFRNVAGKVKRSAK